MSSAERVVRTLIVYEVQLALPNSHNSDLRLKPAIASIFNRIEYHSDNNNWLANQNIAWNGELFVDQPVLMEIMQTLQIILKSEVIPS